MAGGVAPDGAWSLWEVAVTVLGSSGFVGAAIAIMAHIRNGGRNEAIAESVKKELDEHRKSSNERFLATESKIDAIRGDMATKQDLDRWGSMLQESLRTSIAALGTRLRQND